MVVVATASDRDSVIAFVPEGSEGLTIVDDWSGLGQRTTGSGTTILDEVSVDPDHIVPYSALFAGPTPMGPHAQIIHAGVQQGIAEGALAETIRFVKEAARPWKDFGEERHSDDPHVVATVGEVKIRVDVARTLVARVGRLVDAATADPTEETVTEASSPSLKKIASTEAALLAASKLIELGGARATLAEHDLDRCWRNARTHAVHDPMLWQYRFVGNSWLNSVKPPRHGAI